MQFELSRAVKPERTRCGGRHPGKAAIALASFETSRPSEGSASGAIRRVLVVDDSRLQRRILAGSLKKWGFQVIEAESGDVAIDLCRTMNPDLVLSDWMMPGMDGLDFCRAFRDLPTEDYGYFILLTSKSEKLEIAQGLDAGADDFLTKPVNPGELRARISAGDRIIGMQRELSDKNRVIAETLNRLQEAYDSIDRDLKQARKIQQSLVPDVTRDFGASKVSLLLQPCGHIGGDLVGMFSPHEGEVGFYSIDVSGHGITSAMMTAKLGGYLNPQHFDENLAMTRTESGAHMLKPPEDVAAELNQRLLSDAGIDEYFTLAYGVTDLATGRTRLVQAGHPHPLLLRADGGAEFVGSGGMPVGLLPATRYHAIEFTMEPGDRLLLYSDGFVECQTRAGGMLEGDGLLRLVGDCRTGSGREMLDDLFWRLSEEMDPIFGMQDDVSATLFEFRPGAD